MTWSKESLHTMLTEMVEAHGGEIRRLGKGNSKCYEISVERKVKCLVSLKASVTKERLWVGIPDPEKKGLWFEENAIILEIHEWRNTLLFIPMREVISDKADRTFYGQKDRPDFYIEMKGYKNYVIKTREVKPDIPVKIIDDRSQLEELILGQSPPIESSSKSNAIYLADRRKQERKREEEEIKRKGRLAVLSLSEDELIKLMKERGIE